MQSPTVRQVSYIGAKSQLSENFEPTKECVQFIKTKARPVYRRADCGVGRYFPHSRHGYARIHGVHARIGGAQMGVDARATAHQMDKT